MKICFTDLYGTIREPIEGKFIDSPLNQKIMEGADIGLRNIKARGFKIIGISNQGGIQYDYKSLESCIEEMQITLSFFPELDQIYFCPDMAGKDCIRVEREKVTKYSIDCSKQKEGYHLIIPDSKQDEIIFRKPGKGMLELALNNLVDNANDFLVSCLVSWDYDCWMIGDRDEDMGAAKNLGIDFLEADIFRNSFKSGLNRFKVGNMIVDFQEQL